MELWHKKFWKKIHQYMLIPKKEDLFVNYTCTHTQNAGVNMTLDLSYMSLCTNP